MLPALLGIAVSAAPASVNLEWRPSLITVNAGQNFSLGLYAVSDNSSSQSISSIDAILNWDPVYIKPLGLTNNSPYSWSLSNYPNDCGLDGLNGNPTCPSYTGLPSNDGDGYYRAFRNFGNPAFATPSGLLVSTFNFLALTQTPSTPLDIPLVEGQYTRSFIVDGFTAGLEVTGTLGSAKIEIIPEPATVALLILGTMAAAARRRRTL